MLSSSALTLAIRSTLNLSSERVRKLMMGTIILGIMAAFIEYAFAITIQAFFEILGVLTVQLKNTSFRPSSVSVATLALLSIGITRSIFEGLKIFLARLSQQKFAQELRLRLVGLALTNAGTVSSGKIQAMFSDETNRSSNAVLNLCTFLIQISLSIVILIIALWNFPQATIYGLALLTLLYIPVKLIERNVRGSGFRLSEEWEKTNSVLTSGIRNNFYLRVVGMVEDEISRASESLTNYFQTFRRAFALISFKAAMPSSLGIIVLVIMGNFYASGKFNSDFSFLEFFYLFLRFTQSSAQSATLFSEFMINSESTRRLDLWYKNHPPREQISEGTIPPPSSSWSISFKNLNFSYSDALIIKNLNLEVNEGEILLIKGESGAGKSTLLALLLRLLKPSSGMISLNGIDISGYNNDLISKTGYVGPSAFLIEGTIRDNLLYGNFSLTPSDAEIANALQFSELHTHIFNLPAQLNTIISESGTELSTGQKQRLMIARALLRNPKLLIMDEATANLDKETEMKIISNLKSASTGRIVIIVTHKDSFDLTATNIHKMESLS